MRKRAEDTIVTLIILLFVIAEFSLVSQWVVQSLNFIVHLPTRVFECTALIVILAVVYGVIELLRTSTTIALTVIVRTLLLFVTFLLLILPILLRAHLNLEIAHLEHRRRAINILHRISREKMLI